MVKDFHNATNVSGYEIDAEIVRLLPQLFCFSSSVVVLDKVDQASDDPIHVGMADTSNLATLDTISRRFGNREIIPIKLSKAEVTRALNLAYGIYTPSLDTDPNLSGEILSHDGRNVSLEDRVKVAPVTETSVRRSQIEGLEPVSHAGSSSIVDIVNNLLMDALKRGTTDIHIENERKMVAVRFKLDGMLYQLNTPLNKDNIEEVINRIKVMSDLDISERRAPQDGRLLLRTLRSGRDWDVPFRVSILPGPYGEEIVLRVLDKSMAPISLELLGFTNKDLKVYRQLIKNPQGMILVTGPTGSGKTTTLYATLKEINSPYNKILSAEDPIEYNLDGVNQKQITEKFGFADMARAFLRHDPDILLIGEIRDEDTADVACKAAQTGHLILSTVHTNDSISTISRLHVLGLDYDLIGSSLLGVLSQRLVRRVCSQCMDEYTPPEEVMEHFTGFVDNIRFIHGRGCDHCSHTGYRGRIGIFELFIIDDEIQRMIWENRPQDLIMEETLKKGMTPLIFDGLRKVEQSFTTLDELVRVVPLRQIAMQLKRKAKYISPMDYRKDSETGGENDKK
jgi:type II secretory ATPase GspE/PulE/Tfp pilus assembly ATPase PilB-like protein